MVLSLVHTKAMDAAAKFPDNTVFAVPGKTLSYAELFDRASRLATVLAEHGVRRGDRVGVYFQKSLESAVAIYGIMQAGAAYVPLDPAAPAGRTRAVLKQCAIRVLISHDPQKAKLTELLPAGLDTVIGPIDPECSEATTIPWSDVFAAPPAPVSVAGAAGDDLAYIIFTSGSTGQPKGIMHSHTSGLAYSVMAGALYGVGPQDRLASFSPLHFDMSTFDYLCGPQHGAMTMIVPDPYMKLPASLSELVQDEALTIWYSVPFALTQLVLYGAMESHDLTSLRWVLFGGEPFAPKHLGALVQGLPHARFSNVYGPAEVNQCTFFHLPSKWSEAEGQPPIGTSCEGAKTLIVDDGLNELPPGVTGELVVKSASVMQGYWGRPNLTDRVLVTRPSADGQNEIWLRTGDLATLRPNGLLSFNGRSDRQVKVRGYRVEIDEIEDVLASHPSVEEASAFPVRLSDTITTIRSAVTLNPNAETRGENLLKFASSQLPNYAIPETVDIVDAFPRTSSGKIDWKTLSLAAEDALSKGKS